MDRIAYLEVKLSELDDSESVMADKWRESHSRELISEYVRIYINSVKHSSPVAVEQSVEQSTVEHTDGSRV